METESDSEKEIQAKSDSDSETEKERQAKKEFLHKEIVEMNYSPEEFTEFCQTRKGTDIDLWHISELEVCVKEFKLAHQPNINRKSSWGDEKPFTIEQPVRESPHLESPRAKRQSINIILPRKSMPEPWNQESPENAPYSHTAIKAHDNQLSLEDSVSVKVEEAIKRSGGMFSFTKVCFPMTTTPLNWHVERTIDDFIWLRSVLAVSYPACYIPPNPPKYVKSHLQSGDLDENLNKQRVFLQNFISSVVRNQLFRRSIHLQGFLKEADPSEFNQLKKQSNKLKKPNKIEEHWTMEGYVICDPFLEEKECTVLDEYLHYTEAMKKKIKRQTDTLIEAIKEVSQLIFDISKSFEILESLQDYFPEIPASKLHYNLLKNSFLLWSEHEIETSKIIKDYYNIYFKYGYTEISSLKEFVKERENKLAIYQKSLNAFDKKKEKLWNTKDVSKWGCNPEEQLDINKLLQNKQFAFTKMLHKEGKEIEKLKNEFSYYNFQVKAETRRVFLENQVIANGHFSESGKAFADHSMSMHKRWTDFVESLDKIRVECISSS
ncbi:unnamed protein product [Blepharisma stoltei]|uniref:PX domain-containing protein n=1 Tax=Blepharisma stoltei TaxID=1481888 RepID=A0AAU9JVY8_9CILI|nr:unnamed protein product [Blepharisma stoltei]